MRLVNLSGIRDNELEDLIQFCRRFYRGSDRVKIQVQKGQPEDPHGRTIKYVDPSEPISVIIYLAEENYPCRGRLMESTPEITYREWQDVFVSTLAHEFRHVEQMEEARWFALSDYEREFEAESHGAEVLAAFQGA